MLLCLRSGIFIGTTLMGPVFGFLLGSVSSAIYVDTRGKQLSQSNPGYIGAWWLGMLILFIFRWLIFVQKLLLQFQGSQILNYLLLYAPDMDTF